MPVRGACALAGIGVTTLAEWRDLKPEIEERMNEARERARQKALQAIKSAGDRDWRAWDAWLRNAFPADYRGNTNRIEVTATANASSGVVLTEEKLRELQERKHVLMQERPRELQGARSAALAG